MLLTSIIIAWCWNCKLSNFVNCDFF